MPVGLGTPCTSVRYGIHRVGSRRSQGLAAASSAIVTLRADSPVPSSSSANYARHDAIASALVLQVIKATGSPRASRRIFAK